jgi:hypothetical protein
MLLIAISLLLYLFLVVFLYLSMLILLKQVVMLAKVKEPVQSGYPIPLWSEYINNAHY